MKLDDMVLRDGRKLPEVWLDAGNEVRESDFVVFVSIPAEKTGKVFVECGNGPTHMIALYTFHPNAKTDFEPGVGVTAGEAVTSGKIWSSDHLRDFAREIAREDADLLKALAEHGRPDNE